MRKQCFLHDRTAGMPRTSCPGRNNTIGLLPSITIGEWQRHSVIWTTSRGLSTMSLFMTPHGRHTSSMSVGFCSVYPDTCKRSLKLRSYCKQMCNFSWRHPGVISAVCGHAVFKYLKAESNEVRDKKIPLTEILKKSKRCWKDCLHHRVDGHQRMRTRFYFWNMKKSGSTKRCWRFLNFC